MILVPKTLGDERGTSIIRTNSNNRRADLRIARFRCVVVSAENRTKEDIRKFRAIFRLDVTYCLTCRLRPGREVSTQVIRFVRPCVRPLVRPDVRPVCSSMALA